MTENQDVSVDQVLVRDIYVAAVAHAIATKAYDIDYAKMLKAATDAAATLAKAEAARKAAGMDSWLKSLE